MFSPGYSIRSLSMLFLGVIVTLIVTTSVYAGTRSVQFSVWHFSSYTAPSGKFYCSILSEVANKNIGQNIAIKGSPGSDHIVIDLYKDKWNRRQGSSVNVMFDFVDNQPLTLSAYADAHILDIEIPTQHTATFLLELAGQPALQVIFPDEEEETWIVSGQGAKTAVQKMMSCLGTTK